MVILAVVFLLVISGCSKETISENIQTQDGTSDETNNENLDTGYVSAVCKIDKIEFKDEASMTNVGWGAVDNEAMHIYHYHKDLPKDAVNMDIFVNGCSGWDLRLDFNPDSHRQLCTYGKQYVVENKEITGPIILLRDEIYPDTWCNGRIACENDPQTCECIAGATCTSTAATKAECRGPLCESYYKVTATATSPNGQKVESEGYYYVNVIDYKYY